MRSDALNCVGLVLAFKQTEFELFAEFGAEPVQQSLLIGELIASNIVNVFRFARKCQK